MKKTFHKQEKQKKMENKKPEYKAIDPENDRDPDQFSRISVQGDHIYFYADINPDTALILNQKLHQVSMNSLSGVFNSMYEVNNPPPIWLHINSYGGQIFSAFAIADTIERIKQVVPVYTIVEGCAASAATIVSTAGTRKLIRKSSYMLIHEMRDAAIGTYTNLKDNITSNQDIMETIKNWYFKRTKIRKEKLDAILSRDVYWNAETCKKYGLVDDII
jgi:ATP-dependent Clp protease protease subunit